MHYAIIDYGSTRGFMVEHKVEDLIGKIEALIKRMDYTSKAEKDGSIRLSGYMFSARIKPLVEGEYIVSGSTNQW